MGSNYNGTVPTLENTEDSIESIREFWEPIAAFNSVVSEQLIEAEGQRLGAKQMVTSMREAFAHFSIIPIGPKVYRDCKLPHQPPHTFSKGYECTTDSDHKFCRLHSLRKCVICGGDLKNV